MVWATPTLRELRAENRDTLLANLTGTDALPPNSRARVLSDANAALAHGAHLHIEWQSRQFLPDTAEGEFLDRQANIWINGRTPATFASGSISLTGLAGTIVPAGTQLSAAGGGLFETLEQALIGDGPTPIAARALIPGGAANLDPGASAALVTGIAGIDGTGVVVTMSGGVDTESDENLRERVLQRIRKPPMGGDADDYVAWARAVPGVTRAWCSPLEMGLGTVTVRFMMDDLRSSRGGFPTSSDATTVQAAVDRNRPVAVKDVFALPPVPEAIDFTIANLVPDTAGVRAAITANVKRMIQDRAAPARSVNGIRIEAQTIYREWVSAAILAAGGVSHFDLVMDDHPMPFNGSLAVLGTITFL